MPSNTAILTYHSQNVRGQTSDSNDHVALREDLEGLHAAGLRIIPLSRLIGQLDGNDPEADMAGTVCLTFDDGCDFDVRDIDYPGAGAQRSFLGIMQDFIGRHGAGAQPGLHATSFVIASKEARRMIDSRSLFKRGWMSDDWWHEAEQSELLSIGNHGWDHRHPDLAHGENLGSFASVNSTQECEQQVMEAARYIESKTGTWPQVFAYPFGESSSFIRTRFFPGRSADHRCKAAVGTDAGMVTERSDRWNLPRFVCGRDWQSTRQLLALLTRDQPIL
jgi:peptidoglycan/xylan/chitin deacetylase (PgdA/CDA1 family)